MRPAPRARASACRLLPQVGNLGGFVGPYLVGWIKQRTGSYCLATVILGWMLFLSGVMMVLLKYVFSKWKRQAEKEEGGGREQRI